MNFNQKRLVERFRSSKFFFLYRRKLGKKISGGHAYLAMLLKELSMVIQKKMQERKFDCLFFLMEV